MAFKRDTVQLKRTGASVDPSTPLYATIRVNEQNEMVVNHNGTDYVFKSGDYLPLTGGTLTGVLGIDEGTGSSSFLGPASLEMFTANPNHYFEMYEGTIGGRKGFILDGALGTYLMLQHEDDGSNIRQLVFYAPTKFLNTVEMGDAEFEGTIESLPSGVDQFDVSSSSLIDTGTYTVGALNGQDDWVAGSAYDVQFFDGNVIRLSASANLNNMSAYRPLSVSSDTSYHFRLFFPGGAYTNTVALRLRNSTTDVLRFNFTGDGLGSVTPFMEVAGFSTAEPWDQSITTGIWYDMVVTVLQTDNTMRVYIKPESDANYQAVTIAGFPQSGWQLSSTLGVNRLEMITWADMSGFQELLYLGPLREFDQIVPLPLVNRWIDFKNANGGQLLASGYDSGTETACLRGFFEGDEQFKIEWGANGPKFELDGTDIGEEIAITKDWPIEAVTGTTSITDLRKVYSLQGTGSYAVTLPESTSANEGQIIKFYKEGASGLGNWITLQTVSSQPIKYNAGQFDQIRLRFTGESVILISHGDHWDVLASSEILDKAIPVGSETQFLNAIEKLNWLGGGTILIYDQINITDVRPVDLTGIRVMGDSGASTQISFAETARLDVSGTGFYFDSVRFTGVRTSIGTGTSQYFLNLLSDAVNSGKFENCTFRDLLTADRNIDDGNIKLTRVGTGSGWNLTFTDCDMFTAGSGDVAGLEFRSTANFGFTNVSVFNHKRMTNQFNRIIATGLSPQGNNFNFLTDGSVVADLDVTGPTNNLMVTGNQIVTQDVGLVDYLTQATTIQDTDQIILRNNDGLRRLEVSKLKELEYDEIVMVSPDNTRWKLAVNNDGDLITEEVV